MPIALLLFFLQVGLLQAQSNVFGKVYDGDNGSPLSGVQIQTVSGKNIAETDEKGAFAFAVPRVQMKVVLLRSGFQNDTLDLAEVEDIYNVEVFLVGVGEKLSSTVTVGKATKEIKRDPLAPTPRELELFSGMQLDLNDQVKMIPGVSGTKEFKSDLSLLGSLPGEVGTYVGPLEVPWARHLDVGFPGNLSLFPSSLFQRITPVYTLSERISGGGGGGALVFTPESPVVESFGGRFALGTALREFEMETPFFIGDGLRVSYRTLQESVLEKLAEKSFSEFSKRGNENSCDDPCDKSRFGNRFSLNAWDFYAQTGWRDSTGSADFFYFESVDEYEILQDTARSYASLDNQRVGIFAGDQNLRFVGGQWVSPEGWAFGGAWSLHSKSLTQRDTANLWSTEANSAYYRRDPLLIGDDESEISGWQSTVDGPLGKWAGANVNVGLRFEGEEDALNEKMPGTQSKMSVASMQGSALAKLQWKGLQGVAMTAGTKYEVESGNLGPMASIEWRQKDSVHQPYADASFRQEWVKETVKYQKREGRYSASAASRLGWRLQKKGLVLDLHGYGRFYPEATLPRPDFLYTYTVDEVATSAYLGGAGVQIQWFTPHSWALQTQANTLYGKYDRDETLPLSTSRTLDMVTNLRYYPRNDSLLSLILIHRASLGEPVYRYSAAMHNIERDGRFTVNYDGGELNTFRTDFRLHLNLSAAWPPLQTVRFYVEVDNLFAPFDSEALRFLGGDNARQRGWISVPNGAGSVDFLPYKAPGQGLFLQFGVEGDFGF